MIPQPSNSEPVLFDLVLDELTAALSNLSWLDNVYKLAYQLENEVHGKKYKYPAAYIGKKEYMSLLPNDELGNYSFIEKKDPEIITQLGQMFKAKVDVDIIFWFNIYSIYDDSSVIKSENIKDEIIKLISKQGIFKSFSITVNRMYDNAENIFDKYDLRQIDNQYLMMPFCGLKLNCTISYSSQC